MYANIAFSLKLREVSKEAAKILDITQYLDRKPTALSSGQRRRVTIVREPKVTADR